MIYSENTAIVSSTTVNTLLQAFDQINKEQFFQVIILLNTRAALFVFCLGCLHFFNSFINVKKLVIVVVSYIIFMYW